MKTLDPSATSHLLKSLDFPAFSADQAETLGVWLRDTEPLNVKAEMTKIGHPLFRAGRVIRHHGYLFYNLAIIAMGLTSLASSNHWISASMKTAANSGETIASTMFLGVFGAICASKCVKMAIHNRTSYTDALASGADRLDAAKTYGKHLAVDVQSRVYNVHSIATVGAALLAFSVDNMGMKRIALTVRSFEQASRLRSEEFKIWSLGMARKAQLMHSDERRSAGCYREALRLAIAKSLGHFNEARSERQDATPQIFKQLAAGFDRSFPTPKASDPTAKLIDKTVVWLSFPACVQHVMKNASLSEANARYAPNPDMPNLLEGFGILAQMLSQEPDIDFKFNYLRKRHHSEETDSLEMQWAPWRASLESHLIGKGLAKDPTSANVRRPQRI